MKKNTEFAYSMNENGLQDSKEPLMRYIRNWYWFFVLGSIGLGLGFINYKMSPPSYEVSSKILIKGDSNPLKSSISMDNLLGGGSANSNMSNQLEILQSFTNYKRALQNLNWEITWYKPDKPFDRELYKSEPAEVAIPLDAKNLYNEDIYVTILSDEAFKVNVETETSINGVDKEIKFEQTGTFGKPFVNDYFNFILYKKEPVNKGTFYFRFNNLNRMTQGYLKRVQVELTDNNSEVIRMLLEGNIPQKEADFLNELNRVFITLGVEEEERSSETSVNFISEQLGKIKDSLDRSEEVFTDYRRKNQVVDLSQEANFIYQKLEEIESEKYEANTRLGYYQNLKNYLDDSERIKQISSPSMVGINDENLTTMLQKLSELYNRRELLKYSVKEKSPSYMLVEREINLIRNSLDENLNNLVSNTKSEIAGIDKRNREIQGRLQQLPKTEKEMIGMQREFELNNTMYNYMLKKKAEAELSQASTAPKVQIIDKALPEAAIHVGPSMMKSVAGGLGAGLFFPFIVIYLLEAFSTQIRTKEEVEDLTDMTVFDGIINAKTKHKLPVLDNPRSGLAESFRGLRHNIKTFVGSKESTVISLNSMVPGEGKSFVASNLAAVFSMTGKKVLLVGADIRRPKLEPIFGDMGGKGLSSYLANGDSFDAVLMETKTENLFFVPAGEVPPNPTELLENGKIKTFLEEAKKRFEFIIFDNAPFSMVADGMITSALADISLFLVRVNKSNRKNIREIEKIIKLNNLEKGVIVMNATSTSGLSKGYVKKGYGAYGDYGKYS